MELPNQKPLPVILCANKCDLVGDVDKAFLDSFCEANGFDGWFETSAKENHNIIPAGKALVSSILKHGDVFETMNQKRQDSIRPSGAQQPNGRASQNWCCN